MTASPAPQKATAPGTQEIRTLALADITVDDALYSRACLDYPTQWKYKELYQDDPRCLPPLDVFEIAGRYVLADGWHRYYAAEKAGVTALPCRIFSGTARDAILHAVQVNGHQHGLPYDRNDYTGIIRWFLADEDLAALSHREMARRIGCSHTHVDNVAREVEAQAAVARALATVATHA